MRSITKDHNIHNYTAILSKLTDSITKLRNMGIPIDDEEELMRSADELVKNGDIEEAISFCDRFDYINDERTAQIYIRQLKRKGYGKKRIKLELNKKGLKGTRIQGIVDQSVSENDEREGAERLVINSIKRFEREKDALKRRDKIYRFLRARGFSQGVIAEILKRHG